MTSQHEEVSSKEKAANDQWKYSIEKRKTEQEHWYQTERINLQSSHEYSRAATRNIILGNGAALIALLSFLGQIWDGNSNSNIEELKQGLQTPSGLFLVGMFFGMASTACGTISAVRWFEGVNRHRSAKRWDVVQTGTAILGGACFLIGALWTVSLF